MGLTCHVVGQVAMLGYVHGTPVTITITQDWVFCLNLHARLSVQSRDEVVRDVVYVVSWNQ